MRSLSRLTLAVLLALTAGLAACSSDDEDPDASDETTEEDASADSDDDADADDEEVDEEEVDDSSDALPDEAQPYVDALVASFQLDPATPIDDDQAECVSTRIVLIVGLDRITDAGITPEAFADEPNLGQLGLDIDAGHDAYDAFEACGIDFRGLTLAAFAAESADPEATAACLDGAADEGTFREFFSRSLVEGAEFDDSAEAEAFFNQLFACTTVEG